MNPQILNYISIATAIAGSILAYGDTIQKIPGLPGWLLSSWPLVYAIAGIVNKVGNIIEHPQTAANTAAIASVAAQTGSTLPAPPPTTPPPPAPASSAKP